MQDYQSSHALGKYVCKGAFVLVKTENDYVTFGSDLEILKNLTGLEAVPENRLREIQSLLISKGYTVAVNNFEPA